MTTTTLKTLLSEMLESAKLEKQYGVNHEKIYDYMNNKAASLEDSIYALYIYRIIGDRQFERLFSLIHEFEIELYHIFYS